jgi:DNA-binding NarL/FixJ family response regulator
MVEPIRVVLVDDHAVFTDALTTVLNLEPDLRVVGRGGSVKEALEQVRLHQPDVLLLDVHLPDGSGIDAVQAIKRDFPKTQVVLLTSDEEESVLRDAIASGVTGYMSKHEATPQVLQAVRGAARGEALIAPYMLNRLLEGMARPAAPAASTPLTPRELGVLNELALGHDNLKVAERLGMSPNTVRTHVQNILSKLKVHSKLEAVTKAIREGWITVPLQPAA